jgi:hypothetical protein
MLNGLLTLNIDALGELAKNLRSGRIGVPFSALQLEGAFPSQGALIANNLSTLAGSGFSETQIAELIESVITDRRSRGGSSAGDLVISGPEVNGLPTRDTGVVVRELFRRAKNSVLVIGFAVYQGRLVFEELALRMQANPKLEVEFYFNIGRGYRDTTRDEDLLARFLNEFKHKHWPSAVRLPAIYYDPRALRLEMSERASLHAKAIVVDARQVFITSANFTEAAQERNIEVGLKLDDTNLANQLTRHFRGLRDEGVLSRAI